VEQHGIISGPIKLLNKTNFPFQPLYATNVLLFKTAQMENQILYYKNKLKYEIDSWDLSERMKINKNIIVIDVRSEVAYETEHIPGALNIPHRNINVDSTKHLDKQSTYITYCDGIGCNASTKGALNLTKLGFCVKELLGGLDWWKRDGYKTKGTKATPEKGIACGC